MVNEPKSGKWSEFRLLPRHCVVFSLVLGNARFKQQSDSVRNYRPIVVPRKFNVVKTNICPRSFEGKYASFRNIQFPRGNYQTDISET